MPLLGHAANRGPHDAFENSFFDRLIHHRRRRISSHPAGIFALISIEQAFVVLGRRQGDKAFAIANGVVRGLFPFEPILDDHPAPGLAEAAVFHHLS